MKKIFGLLIPVFACLLCFSCKKSGNTTPQAPVITGINFSDIYANPTGTVGSPNVLTNLNGYTIQNYPNPCGDEFTFRINMKQAGPLKLWMVAAVYNNAPDSTKIENQYLFSQQSDPPFNLSQSLNAGVNGILLKTDSLPNGFYRLYALVAGDTLYDNIWIDK